MQNKRCRAGSFRTKHGVLGSQRYYLSYKVLESMPLPNFIIFGAIKSGTGALQRYLSHHPEIFVSPLKEPRFFTYDENNPEHGKKASHRIPITSLEEYSRHFNKVTHEKAIGEASSNYINSRHAAQRIKELLPNVRLIATLRNPVDRAYAHYQMLIKRREKTVSTVLTNGKKETWATSSLYYEKLQPYYDIFRQDQIKIFIFEEWATNTASALKEIYQFLEVDDDFQLAPYIQYRAGMVTWPRAVRHSWLRKLKPYLPTRVLVAVNASKAKMTPEPPELTSEVRREMATWYHDDILKLQDLLQRDLSIWRSEA